MNEKKKAMVIYIAIGSVISIIFAFLSYLICGAFWLSKITGKGFLKEFIIVLSHPFDGYYNFYSPIAVLIGVILSELCFLFVLYKKNREHIDQKTDNNEILNKVELESVNTEVLKQSEVPKDIDIFAAPLNNTAMNDDLMVNLEPDILNKTVSKDVDSLKDIKEKEESQVDVSFDDTLLSDMLADDYSFEQIKAMVEIKQYISNISSVYLKKMFARSMSPDEISSYIALFYK